MPTADDCRAMAAEADRLAALVSYTRDKVRLREQAEEWLRRAAELDAKPSAEAAARLGVHGGLTSWIRRRIG
jgi:TPR repeat protein